MTQTMRERLTFDLDLDTLDGPNPFVASLSEQMQLKRTDMWTKAYEKAAEGYVVQIMDGDRLVSQLMHRDPEKLTGETIGFDMTPRIG